MEKTKKILRFKNESEEFDFWEKTDFGDYFDLSKAKRGVMFPNLKLTTRLVTIRLPIGLIERLKIKANRMDIPYQSLIKQELFKSLMDKRPNGRVLV